MSWLETPRYCPYDTVDVNTNLVRTLLLFYVRSCTVIISSEHIKRIILPRYDLEVTSMESVVQMLLY